LGATFKFNNDDLTINNEEHAENLANFKEILPNVINKLPIENLKGQANFRTSPHDYFPVVGPIADLTEFCIAYSKLRQDANFKITTRCPNYKNLYLNLYNNQK
jgi:tRNA 5-methylaminomethyl-2-thiouridine biosynthesis bifunctional protein